jgi:hypothetical protein
MTQMYELRFKATGEVRDKDGNVVSREPIEGVAIVDEQTARELLERNEES